MGKYFSAISTTVLQLTFLSCVVALALGINYLAAWTGPSASPPNSNVAAPVNIGTTNQVKDANLSVGHSANTATDYGLIAYGRIRSTVGGFEFPDGTVQATAASTVSTAVYSGVFGASGSVTINPPYSSIEIRGKNRQPNGSSTFYVNDLYVSVFNSAGVWKYAWQIFEFTGTGTLATGVQQCVGGAGITACITANAGGTFTIVGNATSGYGTSYMYTVHQ